MLNLALLVFSYNMTTADNYYYSLLLISNTTHGPYTWINGDGIWYFVPRIHEPHNNAISAQIQGSTNTYLETHGYAILQTGQLKDAASTSSCLLRYFETLLANEYEKDYSKTKAYKRLQSISYYQHIYSYC